MLKLKSAVVRDEDADLAFKDFHQQLLYLVPCGVKVLKQELRNNTQSDDSLSETSYDEFIHEELDGALIIVTEFGMMMMMVEEVNPRLLTSSPT